MKFDFFVFFFFIQISRDLGTRTPIIISTASGIIGRDALTDELKEVSFVDFVCFPSKLTSFGEKMKPKIAT